MSVLSKLSATFESVSDLTAVKGVRNFSAKVPAAQIEGDPNFDRLKGDRFVPERSYFSVRIAEMRLAEVGRYGIDFVPMCSCFLKFTYGASQRTVPFVVGIDMISAALGKVSPADAKNIRFEDLYIVRNVPVKADNLQMYSALCRIADSGFARSLINLFADTASTFAGPVAGAAIKGRVDLTGRLATLLGADGVHTRFGTVSGNALDVSGYRVHAGVAADALDGDDLTIRGGQLVGRRRKDGSISTIDDCDYIVVAIEHRATLVEADFGQVSILPFHQRWLECRARLLERDDAGAKAALTKLLVETAASPDVTEADRLGLIAAYRAAYEQWSGAAPGIAPLMGGVVGTPLAQLTKFANGAPASVAAIIGAVRGGLTGVVRGAGDLKKLEAEADLAFLAGRAHAVVENLVLPDGVDGRLAGMLPWMVAALSQ